MKSFLKLIPIILLLGFISISPKTRNLIGTSFNYLSKFVLSTVNNKNIIIRENLNHFGNKIKSLLVVKVIIKNKGKRRKRISYCEGLS